MALIICPECGKEVSDTINQCIHCGFVLKTAKPRLSVLVRRIKTPKAFYVWMIIIGILALGFFLVGLFPLILGIAGVGIASRNNNNRMECVCLNNETKSFVFIDLDENRFVVDPLDVISVSNAGIADNIKIKFKGKKKITINIGACPESQLSFVREIVEEAKKM